MMKKYFLGVLRASAVNIRRHPVFVMISETRDIDREDRKGRKKVTPSIKSKVSRSTIRARRRLFIERGRRVIRRSHA